MGVIETQVSFRSLEHPTRRGSMVKFQALRYGFVLRLAQEPCEYSLSLVFPYVFVFFLQGLRGTCCVGQQGLGIMLRLFFSAT